MKDDSLWVGTRQRLRDALDGGGSPVEQYRRALQVAVDILNVENAHIKRVPALTTSPGVDQDTPEASGAQISVAGGDTDWIGTGETVDHPGYCEIVLDDDEQLAIVDGEAEGYADNPGYADHGVSCYLGTPIEIDGEQYGTVCFVSSDPREEAFTPAERMFAQLFVEIIENHIRQNGTKAALEASRENYDALAEAAPGAVFLCDAASRSIISANNAGAELTGYDHDELTGLDYEQLFPQVQTGDMTVVEWFVDNESTTDTFPDETVLRLERADGGRHPVEVSAEWASGSDTTFQLHIRNLESRRRRERRAEAIFDQTHQFAGLLSPDGTLIEANQTAVSAIDATHDELVGKPFWECGWWTGETRAELREAIDRAAGGEFVRYETVVDTRRGELPIDFSIRPVLDDDDEVEWLIPEGRDISERVKRKQQLDVLGRLLRHNFRNRMTVIQAHLSQIAPTPEGDAAGSTVTEQLERLKDLVSQYYATVELLQSSPDTEEIDLGPLVRTAARDVDQRHETATVSVTVPDSVRVVGVPAVEDALGELIENAVVHNDSESPSVSVSVDGAGQPTVTIADDGGGMSEQDAKILRGTQSIDPVDHGSGIDLWRVYWTLDLAQVDIEVDTGETGTVIQLQFDPVNE
jgi:PAS domain S-box-containing protein